MNITLRSDQAKVVDEIIENLKKGEKRILVQAPTGFGKTAMVAVLMQRGVAKGKKALFTAHLDSILSDTVDRLSEFDGLCVSRIQSGHKFNENGNVYVGSIATLDERKIYPKVDIIFIDECHHGTSGRYVRFIEQYPETIIIGLTATPQRMDGIGMDNIFNILIQGPTITELIKNKILVKPIVYSPVSKPKGGIAMDPVDAYFKFCKDRQTAMFLLTRADAVTVSSRIPGSVIFDGDTPDDERARIKQGIQDGSIRCLVTVNAILEGFDATALDCILLARGFSSLTAYLQAIGRGLRACHLKHKAKKDCLVIDLSAASYQHGLPDQERIWSLSGKSFPHVNKPTVISRCEECLAVFEGKGPCTRCGAKKDSVSVVRKMRIKYTDLEIMTPNKAMIEQARFYVERMKYVLLKRGPYEWAVKKVKSSSPLWVRKAMVAAGDWKKEEISLE
jgi:DNA repair protein RadD